MQKIGEYVYIYKYIEIPDVGPALDRMLTVDYIISKQALAMMNRGG